MAAAACAACAALIAASATYCSNCNTPVPYTNGKAYENNDHEDDGA